MSKQLNSDQNILVQHETGVSLKFLDDGTNYSSRQNTEEDQVSNSTNDEIESSNKNWNSSQQDESDYDNSQDEQIFSEDEIIDLMIESHDLWQKSPLQWYQKWGSAYFDDINDDLEIEIKQEKQEQQQENKEKSK
ncbi:hypothetical protein PPERSA_10689 [Pseudocohnilembus persalinus]|uniref:Uncharacterized protein n=1 Tax=Pseudocohnilembus persalinus TaxID=266149 RepID=A0A0V0QDB4_PSEPJ|nr:hypothetical protein PPERSA_10689 [Pseudocohnilembus persalinus]|eukprot:KRX00190.1 hypothetical protein PPERSA_10689 [Pseudocohnilembus persalinus]